MKFSHQSKKEQRSDSDAVQRKGKSLTKKKNNTGLPDNLKEGIENLSGISMDDVKVEYNSSKPAQLQAHAFAQGTDIHLAPGQQKHLAHEAWHVVQQKQGRVKPTTQLQENININDDQQLEKEADVMGAKALKLGSEDQSTTQLKELTGLSGKTAIQKKDVIQLFLERVRTGENDKNERYVSSLKVEGRPPTSSDSSSQGDHTVAVAGMEFMLERLIDGKTHAYLSQKIVNILQHVEKDVYTKYLTDKRKFARVDFNVLGESIVTYQKLVKNGAQIHLINEALENLLEQFIRLWNKTTGAAYVRSKGLTTGGSGGTEEKNAKKQLHMLAEEVETNGSSDETASQIAMEVVKLVDYVTQDVVGMQELARHATRAIELVLTAIPDAEFDYELIATTVASTLSRQLGFNQNQAGLLDLYIIRIMRDDPTMYSDLEQEFLSGLQKK